jgi:HEAT repeat protein
MTSFFRVKPEEIGRATNAVLANEVSRDDAKVILGALAAAGTPRALGGLSEVLTSHETNPEIRAVAAASIALADTTTTEAIDALHAGSTDPDVGVRSSSILGLGAAAAHGGDDGALLSAELLGNLRGASSTDDRVLYLRAIGNSGDVGALPMVARALRDDDALVRCAAAAALRFMQDPDVDPLLDSVASTDADADVRSTALFAIGFRDLSVHEPTLASASRVDASESMRVSAIELLGRIVRKDPRVLDVLRECASSDASDEVRARARAAMAAVVGA